MVYTFDLFISSYRNGYGKDVDSMFGVLYECMLSVWTTESLHVVLNKTKYLWQ